MFYVFGTWPIVIYHCLHDDRRRAVYLLRSGLIPSRDIPGHPDNPSRHETAELCRGARDFSVIPEVLNCSGHPGERKNRGRSRAIPSPSRGSGSWSPWWGERYSAPALLAAPAEQPLDLRPGGERAHRSDALPRAQQERRDLGARDDREEAPRQRVCDLDEDRRDDQQLRLDHEVAQVVHQLPRALRVARVHAERLDPVRDGGPRGDDAPAHRGDERVIIKGNMLFRNALYPF